jgi:hypothetical protein
MRSIESLRDEIQHRSEVVQIFKWLGIINFVLAVIAGIKYDSMTIFLVALIGALLFFAAWGSEAAIKQRLESEIRERNE